MTRSTEHDAKKTKPDAGPSIPAMGLFGRPGAASVASADLARPKLSKGGWRLGPNGQRAA